MEITDLQFVGLCLGLWPSKSCLRAGLWSAVIRSHGGSGPLDVALCHLPDRLGLTGILDRTVLGEDFRGGSQNV